MGGSDTQHINLSGIGRKQMGQSSFIGRSLNSASSRSSALTFFFMHRPMIPLARGVAILDAHTRFTRLETDASLLTTLGAAVGCRHEIFAT